MGKKQSDLMRVERDFAKIIKAIPIDRIKLNLENTKISDREVTRMMMNADAFKPLITELRTKPRRKE